MPGAIDLVHSLYRKGFPLAVASASPMRIINAVLDKFDIRDKFKAVHSAEHDKHPKPAPDVYLRTAAELNIDPQNCTAIEDSLKGMQSAKAAGMNVIVVPNPVEVENPDFKKADWFLDSLKEVDEKMFG